MIRRRFGPAWDSNLKLRICACFATTYLCVKTHTDAMALCPKDSRSRLQKMSERFCGCHGLAPWSLKFVAIRGRPGAFADAMALRRGGLTFVATRRRPGAFADATALRRGASRLFATKDLEAFAGFLCSSKRESPRRKAVAS